MRCPLDLLAAAVASRAIRVPLTVDMEGGYGGRRRPWVSRSAG
jgi:2-methylisocitrate lyase-like PEP mutase family enzyme